MKAGIITHYDVHNHGAHLQLYALSSQLKELGYDAQALRYKKNYDFMGHSLDKKYSISLRSIPTYIKYLFQNGVGKTLYNMKKRKLLKALREEKNLVGEYYSEATSLDATVIGSDEIFSIEPGLNPCFFGMGVPCDKVISYAGCFGPTTKDFIKEHNAEEFIEAGFKRIDKISVRDQNSLEIAKEYSNKNVTLVCDPVLLYDFSKEIEKAKEKKIRQKYCVVYSYDKNMNDQETISQIKAYAKKRNLKIYSVGFYHKWCDKSINVSPLEMFEWFTNAEAVFTDTFHGTVVSLVSQAQFFTRVGENKNKLRFLLEQYGVTQRQVSTFEEAEDISKEPLDYEVVNKTVQKTREDSLSYLKGALEN